MTTKRNRAVAMVAATLMMVMVAGVPQATLAAKTKQERCLAKAARAVGHAIDPADYAIQLGTSGRDRFSATVEQDLICGFGRSDKVKPGTAPLAAGDIFIGGSGNDWVKRLDGGIFIGGRGFDKVKRQVSGTFRGGDEFDDVRRLLGGTFRGERGRDRVAFLIDGLFVGGAAEDAVFELKGGTFRGGGGGDAVGRIGDFGGVFVGGGMFDGVFDGGAGTDVVEHFEGGTLISVESCTPAPTFSCP